MKLEAEDDTTNILTYTDTPIALPIVSFCQSLQLLTGTANAEQEQQQDSSSLRLVESVNLNGVVYGRLPIFGPPPELDQDDDGEDAPGEHEADKMGTGKEEATKNPRLRAFQTQFGLIDRFCWVKPFETFCSCTKAMYRPWCGKGQSQEHGRTSMVHGSSPGD